MGKNRIEKYLAYLSGEDVKLPEPFTKQEKLLYSICKKGVTGSTETDKTLTQEGKPADAAAVGKMLDATLMAKTPKNRRWDYANTRLSMVCARKGREAGGRIA